VTVVDMMLSSWMYVVDGQEGTRAPKGVFRRAILTP
jgi:hypothetical protein